MANADRIGTGIARKFALIPQIEPRGVAHG
jgi:hypothetical protein